MSYRFKKDNKNVFSDSYNEEEPIEDDDPYYDVDEEISNGEEEEFAEEDDNETGERGLDFSFACEDCDYRWDDYIVGEKEDLESGEFDVVCPMCGSVNISQI